MKKSVETKMTNISLSTLEKVAKLFANSACAGKIYEPKVPTKLRK